MRIQVKKNGVWREVSFEELCALRDAERRAVQTAFESEVVTCNAVLRGETLALREDGSRVDTARNSPHSG